MRGKAKVNKRTVILALRAFALMAALIAGTASLVAASQQKKPGAGKSQRPNILLIIGDDIGMDATSDMYPGLIDTLVKQYGPSGLNHPNYKMIQGRPASTPTL